MKVGFIASVVISAGMMLLVSTEVQAQDIQPGQKESNPVPLHLGPACQFSVLNCCFGDTTYFINQTIRMMKPSWEIADSSGILFSSADTNIKFKFPAIGSYSVTVWADNGHVDSLTKIIVIDTVLKADYLFQQCTQKFINMSQCATSYYWDFGDGQFSTQSLPVHLYGDTGSYAIRLKAMNNSEVDSLDQNIYVYSEGFPTANFTWMQSNDTLYFFGDTLGENFNWNFGDQTTSSLQNPFHVYTDTGDYNVSLLVTNYCGMEWQSVVVHVFPPAGIISNEQDETQLTIYPNPAHESVHVKWADPAGQNAEIRIMDVFGRLVYAKDVEHSTQIEIATTHLPAGAYSVRLILGDSVMISSTFIVK